ncbi:MAG TPA: TonB-dependent receptor [Thermoanaerobaculia bacterium]|nr:TonB-dependent receptor [Thermoanaerobaculia bacterium]
MKPVILSFVLSSSILVVTAFAQTQAVSTASAPVTEEIVVTASALPEKIESTPASATVVTRDEIEQRGARDLADVLREVPGLTISRTGSEGKATSLFTRGSNSTHTLVLWNGIELNNPYFSGYDWGRFSTAGVERVEIVRGPFSALYGSEAVAGVVNVLTTPSRSSLSGSYESGSHGLQNARAGGTYAGTSLTLAADFEHRQDDGFNPNDDFSQNVESLLFRWSPSKQFSLGVAVRHTSYDLGIPFNTNADGTQFIPSPQRRQKGTEQQIAIPIQQSLGGAFSYDLALSESRRSDDFTDPQDPFGTVTTATASTTRRARLTTRTITTVGTIVAGGEYERAVVNDRNNFGVNLSDDRRSSNSLFAEDRISKPIGGSWRFEISLGARYDRFDTFGSQTSPRLAAAWIRGSHKIRVGFGEAFRAPSVGELYFPFFGNSKLNPEHSRSAELGYDYSFGRSGLFSMTLFRSTFRDLIIFDNTTFRFGNVGRARSEGVELGLSANLTSALYSQFSYTYLGTRQDETGQALLRRPRNSGSIFLGYRLGSLDTNIALQHTGQRLDVLPVAPFSNVTARAYTTIDVNAQWHLAHVTPFVKIENAGNKRYEEVLGYRSPSRRASVGLRFGL